MPGFRKAGCPAGRVGGAVSHGQDRGGCLEDMLAILGGRQEAAAPTARGGVGLVQALPARVPPPGLGCSSRPLPLFPPWTWPLWVVAGLRAKGGALGAGAPRPLAGPRGPADVGRGPPRTPGAAAGEMPQV